MNCIVLIIILVLIEPVDARLARFEVKLQRERQNHRKSITRVSFLMFFRNLVQNGTRTWIAETSRLESSNPLTVDLCVQDLSL
jgi:hypothetical protein